MPLRHPHMRLPTLIAVICCACASTGCVRHQATVAPPPLAPVADDGQRPPTFLAGRARTIARDQTAPVTAASPLPLDFPLTAWRRSSAGPLERGDLRVRTDLPWWQRFPADVVADFLPIDATVAVDAAITLEPVGRVELDAFLAHAERDGYFHRTGAAK